MVACCAEGTGREPYAGMTKRPLSRLTFICSFRQLLASPRRPCDPLFAKLSSAVDAPSRLFFVFFFLGRTGNRTPTHFYCVWVVLSSVVLATQAVRKLGGGGGQGGELVPGAQTLLLWGCCPGFCLFIYSFNKGQNACRWRLMVTWTFYHARIYSLIY